MRAFFSKLPKDRKLVGAEIGVAEGKNALSILSELPNVSSLFLVDPYIPYLDPDRFVPQEDVDNAKAKAHERLNQFSERTIWLEDPSSEAAAFVPDHSLDFVYIDGNHDPKFVQQDIRSWLPKLNVTGMIGGHDWSRDDVKGAVEKYAKSHNRKIATEEPDWWFI